jgi:hypothetical protein
VRLKGGGVMEDIKDVAVNEAITQLIKDLRTVFDIDAIDRAAKSYWSWSPAERASWDRLNAIVDQITETK